MSEPDQPRAERALLLFLDGCGIGPPDPARNPFLTADLPNLAALLGGIPTLQPAPGEGVRAGSGAAAAAWTAADARFGLPGLPQSGTGQTALLTGRNAPGLLGRHFGPWVPTQLRALLAAENVLSRATARGWPAAFANATPLAQAGGADGVWRRPAAPPLAAHGAGLRRLDEVDLRARRAVASSITNEKWQRYADPSIPDISARDAGAVLAGIAAHHTLTLFAHYDTDLVGHRGSYAAAVSALERVDAFLGGLLPELDDATLLVLASDHGNIEDVAAGHTLNPVPVIAHGPGARRLIARVTNIASVAQALLDELSELSAEMP